MTHPPRREPTPEQARIIERGLAEVARWEAENGAITEEEMEAARQRYERSEAELAKRHR